MSHKNDTERLHILITYFHHIFYFQVPLSSVPRYNGMVIDTPVSLDNSRLERCLLLEILARRHFRPSVNSRDDTVAENTSCRVPICRVHEQQPSIYAHPLRTHTCVCART